MAELVSWSAELPPWQRDALRRLIISGKLTEACFGDLVAICCGAPAAPAAVPCEAGHVRPVGESSRRIALKSIRRVEGVNALAQEQELTFTPTGLTTIYGENGAGKSGYSRILKHACRAKNRGEVLGDVRATRAPVSPPAAQIEFAIDDVSRVVTWQADVPPDPDLSLVSVFDADTASLRVDQANEVSYTPYPMRLLADLAAACTVLEAKIKAEIAAVVARQPAWMKSPACAEGTRAMTALRALAPATTVDELVDGLALSPDEEVRRGNLTSLLQMDRNKLLEELNRQADGVARLLQVVKRAEAAAASSCLADLVAADRGAESTRAAASAAATTLFGGAPIQGIGSEAWLHLWEAARRYSEAVAYDGHCFPVVDDGNVCVLCAQPLDTLARKRLTSFEGFVRADTQTIAQRTEATRDKLFDEWRSLWPEIERLPEIETFLAENCGLPQLGAEVRAYLCHTRWRLRLFQRMRTDVSADHDRPVAALQQVHHAIMDELEKLRGEEATSHYAVMQRELEELDGRSWLASRRDDLVDEVCRLGDYHRLDQALKSTNTRILSLKSKEIAQALVTDALRDAFAAELEALEIADLRVELVDTGAKKGEQRFQLRLLSGADTPLSRILSEGEFRMIALAAFLAELRVAGDVCGIVFDDPVSSLDHRHRHAVARRLAREATERQVVVFTHDLFFLYLLQETGKEESLPALHHQYVCRSSTGERRPGIVDPDLPLLAQKADHAVGIIRKKLKIAVALGGSPSEWEHNAKMFCALIRPAWERALEGVIGVVLRRFSPRLDFHNIAKLAVLDEADVAEARDGFDWCSRHMHTESLAAPRAVPTPDEIENRLQQLLDWVKAVKAKQSAVQRS